MVALLLAGGSCRKPPAVPVAKSSPSPVRPNIVFILTDDLDQAAMPHLPVVKRLLSDQGLTLERYFVTESLCCPSRASILTGQYPHNHGLHSNNPPLGGFPKFREMGREGATVAAWLKLAGYRTALVGKYLNGYPAGDPTHVPPGWDEWHAVFSTRGSDTYFDYSINHNGKVVAYASRPEDYEADVLTRKAVELIRSSGTAGQPLFLYLAPSAPHIQAIPAPRHRDAFPGVFAPRPPSFDEEDVSDKPPWVRGLPRLVPREKRQIDRLYRWRLQSMLAVEEMVEQVVDALREAGRLEDTYIVFSSDNGFFLGEHRLPRGKGAAYEEAIRVPLIVRGPGIPAGRRLDHIALNIDLAPTFAEIAGLPVYPSVDGRSLRPLFAAQPPSRAEWRHNALIEYWSLDAEGIPGFSALRTVDRLYVEYQTGDRELYDLDQDPYQLQNQFGATPKAEIGPLAQRLETLRTCAGSACR